MHDIQSMRLATMLLRSFNIRVADHDMPAVCKALANHLDAVIYNTVSVTITFTRLHESATVGPKHVANAMTYISSACHRTSKQRQQQGGSVTALPSQYFGYDFGSYTSGNGASGVVTTSDVDFAAGVARAAVTSQMGGGAGPKLHLIAAHDKAAQKFARSIFKMHDIKVANHAFEDVMRVVDVHINCLGKDLLAASPLTVKKLEKVLALKRHAVFN